MSIDTAKNLLDDINTRRALRVILGKVTLGEVVNKYYMDSAEAVQVHAMFKALNEEEF